LTDLRIYGLTNFIGGLFANEIRQFVDSSIRKFNLRAIGWR
jgi:hypothetical protein